MRQIGLLLTATLSLAAMALFPAVPTSAQGIPMERAEMLSAFGERPAFSPDGKRVAFVGKSYGDAYEIELATGRIRNLTGAFPHRGVLRIQYLSSGDYLLTGPRHAAGPNSRIDVDFFVLDKDLRRGLQPLGEGGFEGIAMGPGNTIAWQRKAPGEALRPGEAWIQAVGRMAFENYTGRIEMRDGRPHLAEKRRIMDPKAPSCSGFMEVQDFRDGGNEVVFYCGSLDPAGKPFMEIHGYNLKTRGYTRYYRTGAYAEVEGLAPDGTWAAVECGDSPASQTIPLIDICRLELVPDGRLTKLILGTAPGTTRKINNPVVSPDGKSIAFAASDATIGDHGEGIGIYLMRLAN